MKEYKYVEVKFEAKGVLFHSASEPKEIINKYAKEGSLVRIQIFQHFLCHSQKDFFFLFWNSPQEQRFGLFNLCAKRIFDACRFVLKYDSFIAGVIFLRHAVKYYLFLKILFRETFFLILEA